MPAQYRLLKPHFINNAYLERGQVVTEGVEIPIGWFPTAAVDPLNALACAAFANAGPNSSIWEDLNQFDNHAFDGTQYTKPATWWQKFGSTYVLEGFCASGGGGGIVITGPISSAGIFNSSGTLVRTLWSGSLNDPRLASPTTVWDGTLDDGSVAPTGNYTIQFLTNNVQYTWEGVIGNSSPDHTNVSIGPPKPTGNASVLSYYHAYESQISSMCITDAGEIYFATVYDERLHTIHVAIEANPQYANGIITQSFQATFVGNAYCTTDGTNTYFAWNGYATNQSVVWAVICSSKLLTVFSSGTSGGGMPSDYGTFTYIGSVTSSGDGSEFIQSVSVQKSGNFLFIVRPTRNILTLNKTTGATLQTNTSYFNPLYSACNPVTGDFWFTWLHKQAIASSTWDPFTTVGGVANSTPPTLSSNLLTATNTGTQQYAYSSGSSAAKFYFEVVINSNGGVSSGMPVGVVSALGNRSNAFLGFDATSGAYYGDGTININSVHTTGYPTFGTGDNVSCACDPVGKLVWWRVNGGNWLGNPAANPATGANGLSISTLGSPIFACLSWDGGVVNGQGTAQFASSSWTYSAPSGFSQLAGVQYIPTVSGRTVDGAGNINATGIDITTGLINPVAVAISPDGSTILVADANNVYGGNSQQVKAFNTSDGSVKGAFGTSGAFGDLGGYSNGPAVSNTRFMFNSFSGGSPHGVSSFLAYSSNGSWWLGDQGNSRYLHFSSGNSPTYIEQIAHIASGTPWVCYNDDTRVFSTNLEFKIDYSKSLAPGNGSWTLVNNWRAAIGGSWDQYQETRYAITGTNGRTYLPKNNIVYEMTSSGLRNTGVTVAYDYIDEQFNLWHITGRDPSSGSTPAQYFINPFTGFDGSNNPTWRDNPAVAPSELVITSAPLPPDFPVVQSPQNSNNPQTASQQLANGTVVVYGPEGRSTPGYHLAGINSTTGAITFKTHAEVGAHVGTNFSSLNQETVPPRSPYCFYASAHPGGFQIHKTGAVDFFTGYRGEQTGGNQTNIWHHWHQSGLIINRWGVFAPVFGTFSTTTENPPFLSPSTLAHLQTLPSGILSVPPDSSVYSWMGEPGMAGNAAWGGIALQNGNYYIYHNDEFYHGGVHRWKISNLGSIGVSAIFIAWNSANYVSPSKIPYQFNSLLPFNTTNLPNTTAGWVRSPTSDFGTPGSTPWYRVFTSDHVSDPHLFPDIAFETNFTGITFTHASISYSWTRTGTGNWSLSGIWWQQGLGQINGFGPISIAYMTNVDILDNTGKVILRMYHGAVVGGGAGLLINDATWLSGPYTTQNVWQPMMQQFPLTQQQAIPQFSVTANVLAGTMTVTYAGITVTGIGLYDGTANINLPAQFLVYSYIGSNSNESTRSLSFENLQFADIP
jgi:hypothetical protein